MDKIQLISILGSVLLITFILSLIRYKKLKEEYSLLWLIFSFLFLILSVWKQGLDWFAGLMGIAYAPAALFLILIMIIFIIMIEFSIIISKQSEWIKQTAQDIGLLKLEMDELQNQLKDSTKSDLKKKEPFDKVSDNAEQRSPK
jgi:hypothetical protein